jgi:hypothetical protein
LNVTKVYDVPNIVIPAKARIHWLLTDAKWIPAFAGMTQAWQSSVECG